MVEYSTIVYYYISVIQVYITSVYYITYYIGQEKMTELTTANTALQSLTVNSIADLETRYVRYLDSCPATVETYTKNLKRFFEYTRENHIARPQREDIKSYREYLKNKGLKPTTIQNYMTAVKLFFKWAEQEGLYRNVADHVKGVKLSRDHKKDSMTSEQAHEVITTIDTSTDKGKRDFAIVALMVSCGLRDIEVQRANIEDLRTAGNSTALYVQGKGREERTEFVIVPAPAEKAIREYLKTRKSYKDSDPLFVSVSNHGMDERLTTRSISRLVKNSMKAAGYDSSRLTAHSLRHTAITLSIMSGKRLDEVQQYARHKNLNTTMIYNHAIEAAKNTCSDAVANLIF